MKGYTFNVDGKDFLKKLIKLPTAYYRIENTGRGCTIHSHNGSVTVNNIDDVTLRKEGDKIALYEEGSPLKLQSEESFIIEEEAIIGKNKDSILTMLASQSINVVLDQKLGKYLGIDLLIARGSPTVELNYINFYDENDPVLQKIKEETGGLYLTIKGNDADNSRVVYVSDKDGKNLPAYSDYQYQYTQNTCDVLTIDEIINLIKANNAQQNFTFKKGEKLSDDIYEANIFLNDKTVATLPKIGYYMLNDQLVMRNHVTEEKVAIPRDFHYLKVVKFSNDDYKLTFCNALGNEFFQYKKYDPQYSNISDQYKFISFKCMKKEYNPNFCKLSSHQPSFFITEGITNPGSIDYCPADVFELTNSGKGKKINTLIDEFGYFDNNNKFKYCDYHKETEYKIYDHSGIDEKHTAAGANSEFILTGSSNIILHTITIPELL